jgi:tryptophan-rich sensory protein
MLTAIAVILSLASICWLIWRAVKRRPIRAHLVKYGLSCLAGIFTPALFLSMDIPRIAKVLVCIILGAVLIFLAAWLQRRRQLRQPWPFSAGGYTSLKLPVLLLGVTL